MPWGGESTKGSTDQKEGFYGGPELGDDDDEHPLKGMPTFGKNQFPDVDVPEMRGLVLEYIERVTELGLVISEVISVGLGFERDDVKRYQGREGVSSSCGIGEHSDFGFLSILLQNVEGLQVFSPEGEWVDVPVVPDSFVVNVGDILDRLTSGLYISPLHRVQPPSPNSSRLSIPFFFDPSWTAEIKPFPLPVSITDRAVSDPAIRKRWEQRSTFKSLQGVWGQYLGVKVQKVFPDLRLPEFGAVKRASGRRLVEVRKV